MGLFWGTGLLFAFPKTSPKEHCQPRFPPVSCATLKWRIPKSTHQQQLLRDRYQDNAKEALDEGIWRRDSGNFPTSTSDIFYKSIGTRKVRK